MKNNECCRPSWFKFWQRNRKQLDTELLSMESRGIVFTNMMRYFDSGEDELLEMSPLESMAFNVVKVNIDDSFAETANQSSQNRVNAMKRWHPEDATACENATACEGNDRMRNMQKIEGRGQKEEGRRKKTSESKLHPYGEYGWVKLTDTQYHILLEDFGQAELDRCVRYVDESAQMSGNKNKWKVE